MSISQTLGVVDVVGRLPDPPLSLLNGLAEAGVEAAPLQVALPCVVAAHQACALRTSGSRDSSILRPVELSEDRSGSSPVLARARAYLETLIDTSPVGGRECQNRWCGDS